MKKFEFRLQRLLEIRQKKEDQEKIELAKASGAYQKELNKKQKILGNIGDFRKDLIQNKKSLSLNMLQSFDKLVRNSEIVMKKLEVVIEEKRAVMQTHIDKYAQLKKDKRAVEILKEKAQKRHDEESSREEQSDLDEIGKNLHLRNKESNINTDNE